MLALADELKIKSAVYVVTPEKAEAWLSLDERLKPVSEAKVAELARDMANGAWKLNGEAILFADDCSLIDGRKRLMACIRAGVPFTTLVIDQLPRAASLTLDSQRSRRVGDVLSIQGQAHARSVGTAARFAWQMRDGAWTAGDPTKQLVLDLIEANPDLSSCVTSAFGSGAILTPAIEAAGHFLIRRVYAEAADDFMAGVRAPDALPMGDPRRALAARFTAIRNGERASHRTIMALMVKAWNAYSEGEKVRQLRFNPDGERADEFPRISGWTEACNVHAPRRARRTAEPVAGWMASVGNPAVQVEFSWIYPETAAEMLTRNDRNRTILRSTVEKYARNMRDGKWQTNGQTIKFAASGRLLDGQHRLHACLQSGAPFPAIVVRGLPDDAFDTLDMGERRDFGQVLTDRGIKYASSVAGAVNTVWRIEGGHMGTAVQPTHPELEATFLAHPGIVDCTAHIHACRGVLAPSMVIAGHYLFSRRDAARADEFFAKLGLGIGTFTETDPVWHLRRKLSECKPLEGMGGAAPADRMAWMIRAWNAFAAKKPMRTLRWNRGAEAFPAIA